MYSIQKYETGAVLLDGKGENIATFKNAKLAAGVCKILNHWDEFESLARESAEGLQTESQRLLESLDYFRLEVLGGE